MPNPFASLINDDLTTTFQNAIDVVIDNYGKNCTINYPPINTDCPNCQYDSLSRRSANIYTPGGPRPFTNGQTCPWCKGRGKIETHPTDEITMVLIWEPRSWLILNRYDEIKEPNTKLETWGYFTDVPKIQRATSIIAALDVQGAEKFYFQRMGEAVPQGLKNRYFVQAWQRM